MYEIIIILGAFTAFFIWAGRSLQREEIDLFRQLQQLKPLDKSYDRIHTLWGLNKEFKYLFYAVGIVSFIYMLYTYFI